MFMNRQGLSSQEVIQSLASYGSNEIPDSEPTTFWQEFKETFSDPMIKILLGIAAIMTVMFFLGYSKIYEPLGTITAVIIVAIVSAKTGVASDTKYRELKDSAEKDKCKVIRDGELKVVNIDDVVVNDLVLLQSGDKIPADGCLIEGSLKVDNSALNGEAEECKKKPIDEGYAFPENITGDAFVDKSSLFRGSIVFDGEGLMLIKAVGLKTMMGKMAEEMQESEPDSPLKVKLAKLANQISTFGYIGAVVIAILYVGFFILSAGGPSAYFAKDIPAIIQDFIRAISLAIVIIVCAVPEGLPLMISLVLMQNTSKMLSHNVLVRKAEGIETAGSLNILFSDKTGTITKGHLEVVDFTMAGESVRIEELPDNVKGMLKVAMGTNNASSIDSNGNIIGGNATDQAIKKFIVKDNFDLQNAKVSDEVDNRQEFNSANKFSQIHTKDYTYYKGAPEKFLGIVKKQLDRNGGMVDVDLDGINKQINEFANKAMRVLAFACSNSDMVENQVNEDAILLGLAAIRDDVRPEAKEAIKEVQDAGIQVVMITGDRLETAVAIAKDAGLIKSDKDKALTSATLNEMSDEEVKKALKDIKVIARALPTDKSRMVRLSQEMNLVVGMTGDGVNDTPALKRADVGFAMGSGTEAAKEAGEIVILDDNFKSIKDAIWYGRTIYHNILKFCKFQLVINVAAVIVSAIAPFFGIDEPLKVTHLLFVNLVMDGLGAMMLGNEPALEKYMKEQPRRRDESIISKDMAVQIGTMGLWVTALSFFFLKNSAFDSFFGTIEQKLTAYFVLFIVTALFNGFNVRDNSWGIFRNLNENPGFLKVLLIIVAVQACIVNAALIPLSVFKFIGNMFSCTPFGLTGWLIVVLLGATIIPVDLLRKSITNRK